MNGENNNQIEYTSEGKKPKGYVRVIRKLDNGKEVDWKCFYDNGWYDIGGSWIPNVIMWEKQPSLIQKVQEKYDFKHYSTIEIKGHSSSVFIKAWIFSLIDHHCADNMKIILSEMYDGKSIIENELRLSITSYDDEVLNEALDFFTFHDEHKLFSFLNHFVKH